MLYHLALEQVQNSNHNKNLFSNNLLQIHDQNTNPIPSVWITFMQLCYFSIFLQFFLCYFRFCYFSFPSLET